nr:sugar transferase [Pelagibacterium xiamenense]
MGTAFGHGADQPRPASGWHRSASGALEATPSGLSLILQDNWPVETELTVQRRVQMAAKRVIDIVLSLSALIFLGPFLALVAIAVVTTSRGPVFFKQVREGLDGAPFEVYKFRSMYTDRCDTTGVAQTKAGDPRLTPIGRFLRQTSIDELPQLLNVLRGDMSLIGPRPHVYDMLAGGRRYNELVPYYAARHAMKPGISGWAQANGLRGPTDDAAVAWARIDHDLAYIQNFSLLLDLKIIWLTIRREFIGGTGI